jgi:hypothetical protein
MQRTTKLLLMFLPCQNLVLASLAFLSHESDITSHSHPFAHHLSLSLFHLQQGSSEPQVVPLPPFPTSS